MLDVGLHGGTAKQRQDLGVPGWNVLGFHRDVYRAVEIVSVNGKLAR